MNKLPHEKLREWAEESENSGSYTSTIMSVELHPEMNCEPAERQSFLDLADEIEEVYIPRSEHEEEIKRIVEAQCGGYGCTPSPHHIIKTYAESKGMPMEDGESISKWLDKRFIKRHATKIYDADDVEIKVGDTIYNVNIGTSVTVVGFTNNGRIEWRNSRGGSGTWLPKQATHDKPVFNAEGERIKVGDTVWDTRSNKQYTVQDVRPGLITLDKSICPHHTVSPEHLTNREPDSLEKLRDDILDLAADDRDASFMDEALHGYADRLTALIERGA